MTIRTSRAVLTAVLLCATACLSAQTFAAEQKLSSTVGPKVVDAQKLIQAKDFKGAMAELKDVQSSATKDYDKYIIDRLMAAAAIGLNDMAGAAAAEEAAAASPALPDADKKTVFHDALLMSANLKQWPQTIQYGQQLAQMNALDPQTAGILAIAYYSTNDFPHAQQYAQQSMALSKAAGQQPDPNALQIIMGSEAKQNNEAGAEQTLEQIAVQNPTPTVWEQLVRATFGAPGTGEVQAMYLFRLLTVAGAMTAGDYKDAANNATVLGYPTEAAHLLEQGIASGKISAGQVGAELSKARHDAAMDERSLPEIAAAAARSRGGEQDVKLGEDYWGYGRYADAEAAGRQAVAKGGLKTPWEGPLLIGAAEIVQGKYQDGIQELAQVRGSEAVNKTAHLWSLYAQSKTGGTRAAAPPAQTPPAQPPR